MVKCIEYRLIGFSLSHLSPGITLIRLRGGVSNERGRTRATVMRRWRRSLSLIVAVGSRHA